MRNIDAEKLLKEAWNRHLDSYEQLLHVYKDNGYKIKRNDKTGEHIVEKEFEANMFFEELFKGGKR